MRRVFVNRPIGRDEFAIVSFTGVYTDGDERYFGVVLWDYQDNTPYLYSNYLNGTFSSIRAQLGFERSWILPKRRGEDVLSLIAHSDGDDIENYRDFRMYLGDICEALTDEAISWLHCDEASDSKSEEEETVSDFPIPTSWISEHYSQECKYSGQYGYHHSHGTIFNEPFRRYKYLMGIELEVEFEEEDDRDDFCGMESNWFQRESDSSLEEYGCEIVTIPLLPEDAKSVEFWTPLCNYLTRYARSWDTGRCGLHVHIGREILGTTEEQKSETLGRLLYVYHHCIKDTRLNSKIYGRERGYCDRDGKTEESNAVSVLGTDVLGIKSVRDKVKDSMFNRAHTARYFDINLQNSATIEFRRGRGSIKADRIAMVAEYCERLCIYAKNTPWPQIGYTDLCKFLKATASPKLKEMVERWG